MNKKTRINTGKERIKYIKDLFKIYKDLKKEEINLIGLYIVLRILIHFEKFKKVIQKIFRILYKSREKKLSFYIDFFKKKFSNF